jgi:hypothetical protein
VSESGAGPVADAGLSGLIAEAAAKSGLLWIRPAPGRAWPAWHIWRDGAAYVVSGPGEQQLPPLEGPVDVILRSKDTEARLLTLRADAATVRPDQAEWTEIATALKAGRLNAPDPDGLLERWAAGAVITRLAPTGELVEGPGRYFDTSGAAPPPPTPATTTSWAPWHVRGRADSRRARRRGRERPS